MEKIFLKSTSTVWLVFCNSLFKNIAVYQNMPFVTQGEVTKVQKDKWPLFSFMCEYYSLNLGIYFPTLNSYRGQELSTAWRGVFREREDRCSGIKG